MVQAGDGLLQFRPARPGGPQTMDAMYAPARDLAWNYIPTIHHVLASLSPDRWTDTVRAYVETNNVQADDLAKCALTFATALDAFSDPDVSSPMAALTLAGFFDVPEAARNLFSIRLGQYITGAYFTAVRDLTCPAVPQQLARQLEEMQKKVEEVVECLNQNASSSNHDFARGCRNIGTGLALCLQSTWRSILKLLGLATPTPSGK